MNESTVGVDAGRTSTRTHEDWCDRAEHARVIEDSGCESRMLVRPLADGEELNGWWTTTGASGPDRPLFCLDTVADLMPRGVCALLWMTSTPERVAELRKLLTDGLAEIEAEQPADASGPMRGAKVVVLEPSYGEDAVWHRALNIIAVSPRLDAAGRERAIDELQAEWLRDQLRTIEAKLEAP